MSEAPSTQQRTPTEPSDAQGSQQRTPIEPIAAPVTPLPTPTEPSATQGTPLRTPIESIAMPVAPVRTPIEPSGVPGIPQRTPVESSDAPAIRQRTAIEPSDAHVLVVEDNVPNFVLIARMLAFMGVQRCEWKTSGWQVVQFADTLPRVDLILMDIRLPYEDGYQALQKLRANNRLKDTIVCAVTAEASEDQMRRAKRSGFNGFLGKPLDPDRFPLQIRRLLTGEEVWEWK